MSTGTPPPSRRRHPRRGLVSALVVGVVVGGAAGIASGAGLFSNDGTLDAGSVAVTPACAGTPSLANVRTVYDPVHGYRLRTIGLTSVEVPCQNLPYTVTVADNATGFAQLAEWSGTTITSTAGSIAAPTVADGAAVDAVNSTNNQVRVYYLTRTS